MDKRGLFLKLGNDCPNRFTSCMFSATGFTDSAVSDAEELTECYDGKFIKIDISKVTPTIAKVKEIFFNV